jgi:F0F1-type ATP synthase membrane subunit c/vacuolar-type H+-ATPase subunit K
MEPQRKAAQILRIALLVSVALYVIAGERVAPNPAPPPNRNLYFFLTLGALTIVGMIFAVWRLFVLRSETMLADQPGDPAALKRWWTGYIFTYALCETVVLCGFVLRFVGFTLSEVAPFYVVGFALMLLFSPRRPRIP